jgi:hypothetical protein
MTVNSTAPATASIAPAQREEHWIRRPDPARERRKHNGGDE